MAGFGMQIKPICTLSPSVGNVSVVGIVIACSGKLRPMVGKFVTLATKRYVFTFTIRDENEDTINVSVWGKIDYVNPVLELCSIGAHVQIFNPKITEDKESARQYQPVVSSLYRMDLDELYKSTVRRFEHEDEELGYIATNKLERVFHIPLEDPMCDKVTIYELLRENSDHKANDYVTLVAIVVAVGPLKNYTSKDGMARSSMDVKLMDSTARDKFISVVLWDFLLQRFAEQWIPRSTVLHMTSLKVKTDRYSNRKYLSATSRSVFTIDPTTADGNMLAQYARILPDSGTLINIIHVQEQPDQFIRNRAKKVTSLANLHYLYDKLEVGARQQLYFEAMITQMNLDAEHIFQAKCADCGRRIGRYSEVMGPPMCETALCREKNAETLLYFDFNMNAMDHTETVSQLRLSCDAAELLLGVKPAEFLALPVYKREQLQNRFWMERFEIGIQMEHLPTGKKTLSALHLAPIS